jgi:hypothetical protein
LDDEVEVGFPSVAEAVECIGLDLPSPRVTGGAGVTASDPDVDVLDGDVSQSVIGWQFVQVFDAHSFIVPPTIS